MRTSTTLILLGLTGCTGMPLASVPKLSAIDMTTTPPAEIRVALVAPGGLVFKSGTARMKVSLQTRDGALRTERSFTLAADKTSSSAVPAGENEKVTALRLSADDARAFANLQSILRGLQQQKSGGSLSIGLSAKGCTINPIPGSVRVTAYLKTEETGGYVTILKDADINKLAGQDLTQKIEPCAKQPG